MSEWISVKDRMPEEGEPVLIRAGANMIVAKHDGNDKAWYPAGVTGRDVDVVFCYHDVTHWMPLPGEPEAP